MRDIAPLSDAIRSYLFGWTMKVLDADGARLNSHRIHALRKQE